MLFTQHTITHFYKMHHRGSYEEALKTQVEIGVIEFNELLKDYKFYSFDERCFAFRFIHKDLSSCVASDSYEWLLIKCVMLENDLVSLVGFKKIFEKEVLKK